MRFKPTTHYSLDECSTSKLWGTSAGLVESLIHVVVLLTNVNDVVLSNITTASVQRIGRHTTDKINTSLWGRREQKIIILCVHGLMSQKKVQMYVTNTYHISPIFMKTTVHSRDLY